MIFRRRKVVAALSLLAGAALVFFELFRPSADRQWCFWIPMGAVIIVLALIELLTKAPPDV